MACSILPSRVEELLGTVNWPITGTHHKSYHELYLGFNSFFSQWVCAWGVCECVNVCLMHVGYPWRLEINIRCSIALHLKYWGLVSQLNLELANSACMASQFALGMFCLHFPSTGIRGRPPCPPNIIMDVGDVHTGGYDWAEITWPTKSFPYQPGV